VGKIQLLLRASRPVFWPVGTLIFLGGLFYSHAELSPPALLLALALSFPACLFAFGINDCFDWKADRKNPRKNGVDGVALSANEREPVFRAAVLCGALVAALFLLQQNMPSALFMLAALAIGYAYSAPPLRLKEKPPLDSLANWAICLFVFLSGYSMGGDATQVFLKAAAGGLCIAGFHAFTTIPDCTADRKAGLATFAVRYGKRAAALFAAAACAVSLAFGQLTTPQLQLQLSAAIALFAAMAVCPDEKLAKWAGIAIYAAFLIAAFSVVWNLAGAGVAL